MEPHIKELELNKPYVFMLEDKKQINCYIKEITDYFLRCSTVTGEFGEIIIPIYSITWFIVLTDQEAKTMKADHTERKDNEKLQKELAIKAKEGMRLQMEEEEAKKKEAEKEKVIGEK